MKSPTILRFVFALALLGLLTTAAAAQEYRSGVSGYTSIDYDEFTNTVMAYSETDVDYYVAGDYQAYVSLTVTKDSSTVVASGSARDYYGDGYVAIEFDFAGEGGSTYTATGRHRAYAQLWDYDDYYYPYRYFYYDNWYFSYFEGYGVYNPWYYWFASPGYRYFTRRSPSILLGSTYDSDSLTIAVVNRGTLQAQGPDIDSRTAAGANGRSCSGANGTLKGAYRRGEGTISWSWSRDSGVSKAEALSALQCIQNALTSAQRGNRTQAFQRADNVIATAPQGGVSAPFSRSYHDDNQPSNVRVDVAVYAGSAFTGELFYVKNNRHKQSPLGP
ncbi:MAG TPA: hypothetical protein VF546_13370 [Pyrinomonadaceae bacterium]|jgi:hypothetical protein